MKNIKLIVVGMIALLFMGGVLWANNGGNGRIPVVFYNGHTHLDGKTHGAPEHSGGTNKRGCHNGSVPYHCH